MAGVFRGIQTSKPQPFNLRCAIKVPWLQRPYFEYHRSWEYGSAMFPLYGGGGLAEHGNVIAIAANYRLDAFGFLGSEALRARDNSTGNFGIQDQRRAMEWIRQNAPALGADPTRVMIFGESAGAGSVANHLVRPQSWPYFSRAASESSK